VIPVAPAVTDLDRLKAGGDHWQWDSFFPDAQGNMCDPADMAPYLTRWRIDPNDPVTPVRVERLDDVLCEFPQIDARLEMSRHRHGYFLVVNAGLPAGRLLEAPAVHALPEGDTAQEVEFVPADPGARPGCARARRRSGGAHRKLFGAGTGLPMELSGHPASRILHRPPRGHCRPRVTAIAAQPRPAAMEAFTAPKSA
jgi:hypothetical protein